MSERLGLRVLIVEDEALISLYLQDMLEDMGCTTPGVFASVKEAEAAAPAIEADAAILDVNVGGHEVFPLADAFAARGLALVFSTGYGVGMLPERWRTYPVITKPFDPAMLHAALRNIAAAR